MADLPGSELEEHDVLPLGLIDFNTGTFRAPLRTIRTSVGSLSSSTGSCTLAGDGPYHKAKLYAEDAWWNQWEPPPAHPVLEQRIAPFQTPLERSLSDACLRTCYDPELEEKYQRFISDYQIEREGILYASGTILDDAERYNKADLTDVLYNVPGYTDLGDVINEELYDELLPWSEEEWAARDPGDPSKAAAEVYSISTVIDREPLGGGSSQSRVAELAE